ncbi:MAG TPA: zf-HC2 domain-containing protein, partial [Planctomycetota bacterium]|nr:zf-HC2 domain-containing protein [Planctomycetota bacterium]
MAHPNPSSIGNAIERELPPQCVAAIENFRAYAEGNLSMNEGKKLEAHLASCASCNQEYQQSQHLYALMDETLGARQIDPAFDQRAEQTLKSTPQDPAAVQAEVGAAAMADDGGILDAYDSSTGRSGSMMEFIRERLAAAPWWGVSVALHGLVVLLAGLISMAFELPKGEQAVITVTELAQRPQIEQIEEKKKEQIKDALASKHETPPTDPMSKELSTVVVPPDILAKAELGDHFETINPDRPDTQSAFGNPDAMMFHSEKGSDEEAGGGGTDGALDDALIGVGAGSKGTGGGFGGGNGDGTGVGNGSGRGSFGQRGGGGRKLMVKRHGGNPQTEDAVERALAWLARNQEADGSWNNQKHGGTHAVGPAGDVAMTGFALLAFLGAGHTEKVGKYKENVKKGVAYLIANLKDVPGKKDTARWVPLNYTNGVACMALGEAAGMARIKETMEAAQRAINGVDDAQRQTDGTSEREAWDYGPRGGANDSSI